MRDEEDKVEDLSFKELVDSVNSLEIESILPKPQTGLSNRQKAAFIYWSDHFGLNNPRQLKRLENSYNLLQKVSPTGDREVGGEHHLGFGLLVCLMTLEFVNAQVNSALQTRYRDFLWGHPPSPKVEVEAEKEKTEKKWSEARDIIDEAAQEYYKERGIDSQKARILYISYVNLFVLPAIEPEALGKDRLDNRDKAPPEETPL